LICNGFHAFCSCRFLSKQGGTFDVLREVFRRTPLRSMVRWKRHSSDPQTFLIHALAEKVRQALHTI
jgi:hypothetical protein